MPGLNISIEIPIPETLIGESLRVEVTLENQGNVAYEVPGPDSASEFEYTFLRIDTKQAQPFKISAKTARHQKTTETVPKLPRFTVNLNPGEKLTYKEDLTPSFLTIPMAGKYNITATFKAGQQAISSPTAPVAIFSPQVSYAAAVTTTDRQKLALVFLHQNRDGAQALYQRESRPGKFQEGLQFRRTVFPASEFSAMVATAIELDTNPAGRWYAWLEEKGLGAGVAQEATLFKQIPPAPLDLEEPKLHPVGWQPTGESAIFMVMGKNSKNRVTIKAVHFEARGDVSVSTITLSTKILPRLWAARLTGINPAPAFDVVWCESGDGRTQLLKQSVTPTTGTAGKAHALWEHSGDLVALSLYPLKGETPDVVDLIYEHPIKDPFKQTSPFNFLRLSLTGGTPVLDVQIPLPHSNTASQPRQWALAAKPLEQPAVIALFEYRLMLLRLIPHPQWHPVAKEIKQAGHLHLVVANTNTLWAIWADDSSGLQYQIIR